MRPGKRAESCNGGKTRQNNWFDNAGKIACDILAALPDKQNVNAVINANGKDKTKREHVQQVQRHMHQFHRRDHGRDREGESKNLHEP